MVLSLALLPGWVGFSMSVFVSERLMALGE